MPVPDSHVAAAGAAQGRRAPAAAASPAAAELGRLFARHGHELALVGGSVRDVFLGRPAGDLDLATNARPERVLELTAGWADASWAVGIEFGTVGLRKGGTVGGDNDLPERALRSRSPASRR